ncbi:metalloregulator ArsR/SmtB family transcription factor [Staphylococcus hyicus]|uniref:ArsR/SmtB family transcription factor n=2 Tax=Staphylococcus hyicus TaxID=1284 RepID=A0ACD5FLH7_STAHY|nr:metalloregulator ArsR/SmtB family transcription factor [Staphylococcus hyicus]AJC96327.1 cadmium efflux system accessory protein [Staphylococcus hyicus]MDP4447769.1 metalloregulator ArsR/SmtB family transcription factor [Staphylococcus hyicus]MDP4461220.1 metalloregulator ArsR/SmtB family transcription factor [Staphylococcus hyicus]MDP4462737.1 metalloregulator ArsR/SmtB family transcription factor [Staphylococcus hyicus]MDP4468142.1 metalloregulator ArsR/SmtB family transcription factor [S
MVKEVPTCESWSIDETRIKEAKDAINQAPIKDVSQMFKSIADLNRAKMTYALCIHEELCVCDIATLLNITVANASHHLRLLYHNGVVTYRKDGKRAMYRIYDEHIRQIMLVSIEHKEEVTSNETTHL